MSDLTKVRNPHVAAILRAHGWYSRGLDEQKREVLRHPHILDRRVARRAVSAVMAGDETGFHILRYGFVPTAAQLAEAAAHTKRYLARLLFCWKTAKGRQLSLGEIEDLHLMNIISQCRRRRGGDERLPLLIEEAHRRGFNTDVH